jgi:hypothetical protein
VFNLQFSLNGHSYLNDFLVLTYNTRSFGVRLVEVMVGLDVQGKIKWAKDATTRSAVHLSWDDSGLQPTLPRDVRRWDWAVNYAIVDDNSIGCVSATADLDHRSHRIPVLGQCPEGMKRLGGEGFRVWPRGRQSRGREEEFRVQIVVIIRTFLLPTFFGVGLPAERYRSSRSSGNHRRGQVWAKRRAEGHAEWRPSRGHSPG